MKTELTLRLKGFKNCQQQLRQQWSILVVVVLQQSNVVGQVVVGATTSTGAGKTAKGRGITTAITSLETHFLMVVIMG